jgi:hypothetical protein
MGKTGWAGVFVLFVGACSVNAAERGPMETQKQEQAPQCGNVHFTKTPWVMIADTSTPSSLKVALNHLKCAIKSCAKGQLTLYMDQGDRRIRIEGPLPSGRCKALITENLELGINGMKCELEPAQFNRIPMDSSQSMVDKLDSQCRLVSKKTPH